MCTVVVFGADRLVLFSKYSYAQEAESLTGEAIRNNLVAQSQNISGLGHKIFATVGILDFVFYHLKNVVVLKRTI